MYRGYYCFITEYSLGYYGYNCSNSCDGCLSDACDKKYGVCTNTSGCKPGWQPGHTKCDSDIVYVLFLPFYNIKALIIKKCTTQLEQ